MNIPESSFGYNFIIIVVVFAILIRGVVFFYNKKRQHSTHKKLQIKLNFPYTVIFANHVEGIAVLSYMDNKQKKLDICYIKNLIGIEDTCLYVEGNRSEQDVIFEKRKDESIVAMHPGLIAEIP